MKVIFTVILLTFAKYFATVPAFLGFLTQTDARSGHQFGYLTDTEYAFAQQFVIDMRQTRKQSLSTVSDVLQGKLLSLAQNDQACVDRLIEYERRRSPSKSEASLYEDASDRLMRDRR
jgi:hypothetical protein